MHFLYVFHISIALPKKLDEEAAIDHAENNLSIKKNPDNNGLQ